MKILEQDSKYRSKVTITLTVDHHKPLTKTYLSAVGKKLGYDQLVQPFYGAAGEDAGESLLSFVYADSGRKENDVKVTAAHVKTHKA